MKPQPDITEQEAVALASEWANYWLRERSPPPGHQVYRSIVKDEALTPDYDDQKGAELLAKARAGDRNADAALAYIARKLLLEGKQLPKNLFEYVTDLLSLRFLQAPPKAKGRDPNANLVRDGFIVVALAKLDRLGFTPTTNEATDKPSGCSIVAQALRHVGENIDHHAVAKVWGTKRHLIRPVNERYPPVGSK